jgi:cytoskeletal protein CcmA (bactofilin family)
MWKKEDAKPQAPLAHGVPPSSPSPAATPSHSAHSNTATSHRDAPAAAPVSSHAAACISQGIRIKGEITGSEDLFVDGPIEGKLNLANGSLTIGPNGSVKADVVAREVIVRGRLEGKIAGRERVQLWSTGQVLGEIQTQRLAIEDGAILRGKVETGRPIDKATDERSSAAAVAGKSVPAATI